VTPQRNSPISGTLTGRIEVNPRCQQDDGACPDYEQSAEVGPNQMTTLSRVRRDVSTNRQVDPRNLQSAETGKHT
jgi:hypothetical protein